jgi:cytochrome c-type biogenesis protein CcmH/NrfG
MHNETSPDTDPRVTSDSARLPGLTRGDAGEGHGEVPIFIHSSWRVSHTWFWLKFRKNPATICFCEPFHEALATITRPTAENFGPRSWNSGHPAGEPYFREFLPLIRKAGGVRLFVPEISCCWFTPVGGVGGRLRAEEQKYLALILRHASRCQKIPVFGFSRSIARLPAIRKQFSGLHIFQYRNWWTQWLSFLVQQRNGNSYFIERVLHIMLDTEDAFLSAIVNRFLVKIAAQHSSSHAKDGAVTHSQVATTLANGLSRKDLFTVHTAFHGYLFLIGQSNADLVVNVTRLARSRSYREHVQRQLTRATRLQIDLTDAVDIQQYDSFDPTAIDWHEIRENLDFAVAMLDHLYDRRDLLRVASEFIEETRAEIDISERYIRRARDVVDKLTSERDALAAATSTSGADREQLQRELDAVLAECERLSQRYRDAMAVKEIGDQQCTTMSVELAQMREENARLQRELDEAHADGRSLASKCEALCRTRESLSADCERLSREKSLIENERDRAAAERERWFAAAIRWPNGLTPAATAASHGEWIYKVLLRRIDAANQWFVRLRRQKAPRLLGDQARDARQWELAARYYLDEVLRNPGAAPIWVQLGHALKEAGRTAHAETAYRNAASFDGASLDTLLSLAHALTMLRKDTEASALYAQALALAPPPAIRFAILEQLRGRSQPGDHLANAIGGEGAAEGG